ncbi:MAG: hypothetical protein O2968_04075 [Acidobacteria bacterium]|nr:hypothetical protein [Acidobacteriota bacterium]
MKTIGAIATLMMLLVTTAPAISIKVIAVNPEARTISVLLPMHNTHIEGRLAADEPAIQVELGKFYKAKIVSGLVDTVKRNWIQIETDDGVRVRFRMRRIQFLD